MSLTDLLIKKLKPPEVGQKTYFDGRQRGFGVRVSMGGAKTFVLVEGKGRKIHSLGRYPELTLLDARKKAKEVLGQAVAGKAEPSATLSFSEIRELFFEDSRMRTKPSTHAEYVRLLKKHFVFSKLAQSITRADLMEAVTAVREHPSLEQHCFVAIRTLFNWAVRHGYLATSPVPTIRFQTVSRTRILTENELTSIWHRAEEVGYPYGVLIKLLILTGQRRGEIAGLRRSWISKDAITFPVGFCKNKREHVIPLGAMAKSIIDGITSEGELLFPARGRTDTTFSGWSKAKAQFDVPLGIAPYTLHDLRRTFSSQMAELGTPIHVTEKLLNHVSGTLSGVAGVYNRYSYATEMRSAVEAYETRLQALISSPVNSVLSAQ